MVRFMAQPRPNERANANISLPGGELVPVLGVGTWNMGEKRNKRADEIDALQMAVDQG